MFGFEGCSFARLGLGIRLRGLGLGFWGIGFRVLGYRIQGFVVLGSTNIQG